MQESYIQFSNIFGARFGNLSYVFGSWAIPPTFRKRLHGVYMSPARGTPPMDHQLMIRGESHLPDPRRGPPTNTGQRHLLEQHDFSLPSYRIVRPLAASPDSTVEYRVLLGRSNDPHFLP